MNRASDDAMLPKSHVRWIVVAALACAWLAACAPGANPMAFHASAVRPTAGFLLGLWHGMILWVTFVVSLFDHRVSVYEVYNNGWAYNLGFVIGAACLHGGGGAGARRSKRRKPEAPRPDAKTSEP